MGAPNWCYAIAGRIMSATGGEWSESHIDVFAGNVANLEDHAAAEEAGRVVEDEWRSNRPVPWAVYLEAYRRARTASLSNRALPAYSGTPVSLGEHVAYLRRQAEKGNEEAAHELDTWKRHAREGSTWWKALGG